MSRAIVLCALLVCGCESMTAVVECHGQNWYRLGLDDGKAGAKGEAESYSKSCGADFDARRYQQGYDEGARR